MFLGKLLTVLIEVVLLSGFFFFCSAQVKISEFLTNNVSVNPDNWDFEDFSDWIELHNEGNSAADIGGYYLTGDLKQTKKWQIPSGTTIPAGGYLLIWADDHNGKPGQQETREWYPWTEKYTLKGYHAVFCLDKEGEQVGLFKADGSIADSVTYPKQFPDVSMGRKADGSWAFFDEPTPGSANATTAKPLTTSELSGEVTFSVEGGMYTSAQTITLGASGGEIYYTTDGSIPYESDKKYTAPITASKNTIIRARCIAANKFAGKVITNSYFINEKAHTVMTVSLSTDPAFLNDPTFGIWKNNMKGREIPVALEFFTTDGKRVIRCNAGVRNGTLTSFTEKQHPMQVALRKRYGDEYVNYKVFSKPITRFDRFRLRQGGDVWATNFIGDALLDPISEGQMNVGYQSFRSTVLFVNGEYYGLTNLREQFKDMFFTENFGYTTPSKRDEVRSILQPSGGGMGAGYKEGWELMSGSWDSYRSLISSVKSGTIDASRYVTIKNQADISSLTDFFCLISFGDAVSWGHNQDLFKMPEDKWKWLVTDFDRAWTYGGSIGGVTHNPFTSAAGTSGSIVPNDTLFSKLIAYADFRNFFVQRYAAHLNSTFKASRLTAIVDSIQKIVEPEMADQAAKWGSQGGIKSVSAWKTEISNIKKFMTERQDNVWKHLTTAPFNAKDGTGDVTIKLSPSEAKADIFINGVNMTQTLTGISMFKGIPFTVKAAGKSGWKCAGWTDSNADSINVTITGATTYTCKFEKSTAVNPGNHQMKLIVGNSISSFTSMSNGYGVLTLDCAFENPQQLEITLFDLSGRTVGKLLNKELSAGFHKIHLPVSKCVSGVFLYNIKGSSFSKTGMVTVK
ncbi:MAG TPA: CotH kinase family protein [Chitinispirillaceae bacterium]|nr:CotH kinase family protein [Chitinispirillaceae bacterium]